jgi:hypothetical protein
MGLKPGWLRRGLRQRASHCTFFVALVEDFSKIFARWLTPKRIPARSSLRCEIPQNEINGPVIQEQLL